MSPLLKRLLSTFLRQFITKENARKLVDFGFEKIQAGAAATPNKIDDQLFAAFAAGVDRDALAQLLADFAGNLVAPNDLIVIGDDAAFAEVDALAQELAVEVLAPSVSAAEPVGAFPIWAIPLIIEAVKFLIERRKNRG